MKRRFILGLLGVSHLAACGGSTVAEDPAGTGGMGANGGGASVAGTTASATDDGCMGQAHSISISRVSISQAVDVPLMKDGAAINVGSRNAAVVQGRAALVRVFVDLADDWAQREVSVRLYLTNNGATETLFAKKSFSASSQDASLDSTASFELAAPQIAADTQYAVEIVECTGSTGTVESPRFPVDGSESLGATPTGALKVVLVPVLIESNGNVPDTSETALTLYRNYLNAMYPVSGVELSVSSAITASSASLDPIVTLIEEKRAADQDAGGAANDVFYFGLVTPAASFDDYCAIGQWCESGLGYTITDETIEGFTQDDYAPYQVAAGIVFADEDSAATMAHEIGHNHGLLHSPCDVDDTSSLDPNYPYDEGEIGVWGYDSRTETLKNPTAVPDVMSYCLEPWISDYSFAGLVKRVARNEGVTSASMRGTPPERQLFRRLLVNGTQAHWDSNPVRPRYPVGRAENADVYDAAGAVIAQITVYRLTLSQPGRFTILVPEVQATWSAIAVDGVEIVRFED